MHSYLLHNSRLEVSLSLPYYYDFIICSLVLIWVIIASVEIFPCARRHLHLMYLEAFLLVGPKLCCIFHLFCHIIMWICYIFNFERNSILYSGSKNLLYKKNIISLVGLLDILMNLLFSNKFITWWSCGSCQCKINMSLLIASCCLCCWNPINVSL